MNRKRWISLYVENEPGVLARISGLFSQKAYNLDSLTVGVTEDASVSRMTIGLTSDDRTFEQIKKQLNRSVEVIRVVDLTDAAVHMRELMFVKVSCCSVQDMERLSFIKEAYGVRTAGYDMQTVLLECVQTEQKNDELKRLLESGFPNRIEIVRGGSVAVEAVVQFDVRQS